MAPRKTATAEITISAPRFETIAVGIVGTSPYVQNKFSAKARAQIKATQEAGPTARSARKREPKDFVAEFEAAIHRSDDGWCGIPAPAFRNAMISACRIVGYAMTRAKLAFHVLADGFDAEDRTPLVKILEGEPVYFDKPVRNETGVADLRARPLWNPGWRAIVSVRYDADMFEREHVVNLLSRAGQQVGIGEGRPDSKKSNGQGWGLFDVEEVAAIERGEA
jgi:hypothetical protein